MQSGSWTEGRCLVGVIAVGLVTVAAANAMLAADPVDAARLIIRLTARTSLILFGLAFLASSLVRLVPSRLTRWIRRNRRGLGVSFALSHLIHLGAIVTLCKLDPALFWQLSGLPQFISGGLAFGFIFAMAITSSDAAVRLIGATAWGWLHWLGAWYIWISFAVTFGKRLPGHPGYIVPVAMIAAALLVRLFAAQLSRDRQPSVAQP